MKRLQSMLYLLQIWYEWANKSVCTVCTTGPSWQELPVYHKPIQRLSLANMKLELVSSFKYLFHSSLNTIHLQSACRTEGYTTRNSAIADKPARLICAIYNGVNDPLKHTRPLLIPRFIRIKCSRLKQNTIKKEQTRNTGYTG